MLELHGGLSGIRDIGMLHSALARPVNVFHYEQGDIPRLAAAYAFGIARNHPFVDGNKRTAFLAMYAFLKDNGVLLTASQEDAVLTFLALAAGDRTEDQLADWIRSNSEATIQ